MTRSDARTPDATDLRRFSARMRWLAALADRPAARALRDGAIVAGLLFGGYLFLIEAPITQTVGFDAFAYWSLDPSAPYTGGVGALGAFPYTPVAVRLFAPAHLLAWPTFLFLWLAMLVGTAVWLGGRRALWVLAFPPVAVELYHGNIHLLLAAGIALGFRYPAAWAFILLTKVTPGVGLLWFVVRREWRSLAMALGVTGVLVAASLLLDGKLWTSWVGAEVLPGIADGLVQPHLAVPLVLRLPAAAGIVIWGAATDRRWTVPVAAAIALPVAWIAGFAILAAIPAVQRPELRERAESTGRGKVVS